MEEISLEDLLPGVDSRREGATARYSLNPTLCEFYAVFDTHEKRSLEGRDYDSSITVCSTEGEEVSFHAYFYQGRLVLSKRSGVISEGENPIRFWNDVIGEVGTDPRAVDLPRDMQAHFDAIYVGLDWN